MWSLGPLLHLEATPGTPEAASDAAGGGVPVGKVGSWGSGLAPILPQILGNTGSMITMGSPQSMLYTGLLGYVWGDFGP